MRDPAIVARWLYRFGTAPRGPSIDRDFGPDDDPMAAIGLTAGGRARRLLEPHYEPTSYPGWYSFARRESEALTEPACKLYASPRADALPDAFPVIVEQFARANVRSFKVGRGIEGLLRPDKIVAYFDDPLHLMAVARALDTVLAGCPAQGVPFTAEVGGNGLLSSGVDPPLGHATASWRGWVTRKLADALVEARALPGSDGVASALGAIGRAGVDPASWAPTGDVFRETAGP